MAPHKQKPWKIHLDIANFRPWKEKPSSVPPLSESLLDSVHDIFGSKAKLEVLTTNHLTNKDTTLVQNYTILESPEEIVGSRIVGCHPLPYPYAVFYCHSQASDNKLFKVALVGENGARVEAQALRHKDTSQWNRDHAAFLVLNTEPGRSPVSHFFPADNLIWIS